MSSCETFSEWTSAPTVKIIHFDGQSLEPSLKPVRALADSEQPLIKLLEPVDIPPSPDYWEDFAQAVVSSQADIVVPTLHGAYSTSMVGPATSRGENRFEHYREIEEIFSGTSIAASVLMAFVCFQERNHERWRNVAPSSTLILADDEVGGIATVLRKFLHGDVDDHGKIPMSRGKTWSVHEAE